LRELLEPLLARTPPGAEPLTYVAELPEPLAKTTGCHSWVPDTVSGWPRAASRVPWTHQITAAQAAFAGQSLVVATGTASASRWPTNCPSGGRWRLRLPRVSYWAWWRRSARAGSGRGRARPWCWPACRARRPRCFSGPGAPGRRRWCCSWRPIRQRGHATIVERLARRASRSVVRGRRRLPVLHAVARVRQRQRPARQARCGATTRPRPLPPLHRLTRCRQTCLRFLHYGATASRPARALATTSLEPTTGSRTRTVSHTVTEPLRPLGASRS
jgi:hypothetical protein